MKNPVEYVLGLAGTTQADFRARYQFSRDGVVQALNGSYATLPDRLVSAVEQEAADAALPLRDLMAGQYHNAENLDEAYLVWQHEQRMLHADGLVATGGAFRSRGSKSPAYYFMADSFGSRDRFARMMCLPRASLMRWERGYTKMMPAVLRDALTEVRYPYVAELDAAMSKWLEKQ